MAMARKGFGKKPAMKICVEEEVRMAVELKIDQFLAGDEQELEFPSSFSSTDRAYIHKICVQYGLKSKSKGKGVNRYMTIKKKKKNDHSNSATLFNFGQNSSRVLHSLLHRWPVKLKEKMELQPKSAKQSHGTASDGVGFRPDASKTSGRLNNGIPQVPVKRGRSDLDAFRKTLPVAGMAEQLVAAVEKYPVVLICGATGSGKTTQIPQFILDDCYARGEKRCRILCAQPRRISAVAMAERVAAERGECVGHTVGYQIRLESRVSPRTLLTFCTNGVLLRTLMAGDNSLSTVTHVIVDEVHERDRFCDFLLIKLRQLIQSQKSISPRHQKFKLVLMSAALDVELFVNYFSSCPVINIPGKMYDVKEYYLEDILKMTGKFGTEVLNIKDFDKMQNEKQKKLPDTANAIEEDHGVLKENENMLLSGGSEADSWRIRAMDEALYALWHKAAVIMDGDSNDEQPSPFPQIFHLIQSENVPVDYRHSETGVTVLMASAMQGAFEECGKLISFGADATLKAANGWTAADMALQLGHQDLGEVLSAVIEQQANFPDDSSSNDKSRDNRHSNLTEQNFEMSEEDRQLVAKYQQNFDDERVDTDLIMQLLTVICKNNDNGAILVFLTGYDDIITLREMILSDEFSIELGNVKLFLLHSSMQSSSDQKQVFKLPPPGYRKIILSTNIAETAVTIEDVVYVVDAGKVKIKIYEALTSTSTLKSVWISKSSALQRKGRAGRCRPGICFHLFSRSRYVAMSQYQTAELLRTPLHELCLQAKLLSVPPKRRRSRSDGSSEFDDLKQEQADSIADFLSKAPEAPSRIMLANAVDLLKTIDALDPWEDLTELGHHLVDLPIEPRLGKMVLYSVVLKCLDPVLTIACALAYKDPFVLPQAPEEKRQATNCRAKFSAGAFSDHMCLLRSFQAWQKAKSDGWERAFCDKNYLSSATMQMIIGMRTQLLGQLRAAGFVRARGGSDIRDLNTNSENWAVVKAALCASAYPSILRYDREKFWLTSRQHKKVRFHTSSVLSRSSNRKNQNTQVDALLALPTDWVVYDELTMAAGYFSGLATARCCTAVTPACISLFTGPAHLPQEAVIEPDINTQQSEFFYPNDSDSENDDNDGSKYATLLITDWIRLKMDPQLCEMILDLRTKWYSLFLRRIRGPAKPWLPEDEAVLSTIINILSSEDQAHNLLQPSGIGQRPRPMSQEDTQRGFTGVKIRTPSKNKPDTASRSRMSSSSSNRSLSGRLSASLGIDDRSCGSSPCLSPQSPIDGETVAKIAPLKQVTYLAVLCKAQKNIQISQRNGVWLTTAIEEKSLSFAFQNSSKVLLLVFLQDTTFLQGYARLTSPGTFFTNESESQNFGWEKEDDSDLTSYFSVEWIIKTTRHIEAPPNQFENSSIWELDLTDGDQLIAQYGCDSSSQVTTTFSPPTQQFIPNNFPAFGYPSAPNVSPANMFNPYHQGGSPSSLHPMYQRYPNMGQFYNSYQYPPHQQPGFTQPVIPPSSNISGQLQSFNFLRQNK
ncbi:3'-5' RNA helicase YTHDC2-like [Styela clava]